MLFRNLTYEDLKRLKAIDSYQFTQYPHFTNEIPVEVVYSNGSETIQSQTDQDKKRIQETIIKFTGLRGK